MDADEDLDGELTPLAEAMTLNVLKREDSGGMERVFWQIDEGMRGDETVSASAPRAGEDVRTGGVEEGGRKLSVFGRLGGRARHGSLFDPCACELRGRLDSIGGIS